MTRGEPQSEGHDRAGVIGTLVGILAVLACLVPSARQPMGVNGARLLSRSADGVSLRVLGAGAPLDGARVVPEDGAESFTDARGRLDLAAETPIEISSPGWATVRVMTLGPGEAQRVELRPALLVAGLVSDGTGTPIAGARIEVTTSGDDPIAAATLTDTSGNFRVDSLGRGAAQLTVTADGFGTESRAVEAESRGAMSIVLSPAATIGGVVYTARGEPAVEARVRLVGSGVWPAALRITGPEGRYRFADIPPGIYEVHATRGREISPAVTGIMLDTGASTFVPLRMLRGERLTGIVRTAGGAPIEDAEVRVVGGGVTLDPVVERSGGDGRFTFAALLPSGPSQPPLERVLLVRATGFVDQEVPVSGDDLVIVLERSAVIRGVVVDERDRPVPGASIQWLADGVRPTRAPSTTNLGVTAGPVPPIPVGPGVQALPVGFGDAVSGPDGTFLLEGLDPGTGRLHATHPELAPAESRSFALAAAETVTGIRLVMQDGALIEGRVVDARGFGVGSIPVEIASDRERLPRSTMAAEDGSFAFGGALGTVTLTARPFGAPAAREILLVRSGERHDVRIVLATDLVELRGRVVDERGFPIASANLRVEGLRARAPLERVGDSGRDGTFVFSSLPAPPYTLYVDHPDYALSEQRIDSVDDEVRVTLRRGGELVGTVVDDWRSVPLAGARVVLTASGDEHETRTDASGTYRFERLPLRRYAVRAEADGRLAVATEVVVDRALVRAPPLRVGAAGGLDVEVVGALGYPAPNARILVDGEPLGITDASGRARVGEIAPGVHEVAAVHADAGQASAGLMRVDADGITPVRIVLPERIPVGAEIPATVSATEREGVAVHVAREGERVVIDQVVAGSRAASAGLRVGDEILRVEGEAILSAGQARAALRGPPGGSVRLEIRRRGQTIRRSVPREVHVIEP